MKTCRFCMHEQDSGEYCEACGSPFSADKLDFSDASMPDPTAGAFPDPTKSAFPKTTESVFPEPAETPATPVPSNESAPNVMPVSVAGMPSSDTPSSEETVSEVPSPAKEEKKPKKKESSENSQPERKQTEKEQPEKKKDFSKEPKKIMYSASQNHETVYLKGKGNYLKKGPVNPEAFSPYLAETEDAPTEQQGAGWWNGAAPSAGPTPSQTASPATGNAAAVPSWLNVFAIVMIVVGAISTPCFCGAGFIPMIMALIAHNKISSVKNGSSEDCDHDLNTARVLLIVSVPILVLTAILMVTTVLL